MTDKTEIALKISKIVHDNCDNVPHDIGLKIMESLSLPLVSDCVIIKQHDCLYGNFEMQCCGNCKAGPITKLENYCPKCGHKIGKHCR